MVSGHFFPDFGVGLQTQHFIFCLDIHPEFRGHLEKSPEFHRQVKGKSSLANQVFFQVGVSGVDGQGKNLKWNLEGLQECRQEFLQGADPGDRRIVGEEVVFHPVLDAQ